MAWSTYRLIVGSRVTATRRSRWLICGSTSMLIRGRVAPDSIGRHDRASRRPKSRRREGEAPRCYTWRSSSTSS